MSFGKLSVLVPAFNEAATMEHILSSLTRITLPEDIQMEVIVIDDGSTDGTAEKAHQFAAAHPEADIRVVAHQKNKGKGAAIHSGLDIATGTYCIIQDADLEYDPRDLARMLQPVLERNADVVYGTRFSNEHPHRVLYYWHFAGNKFLTGLSNMFSNLNLTDMETCYKLMRTEMVRSLKLKERRFGFEPEVTQKLAKIRGVRFYEVGISYHGRTYAEGKKIKWTDGLYAIWCIIKYGIS